MNVFADDSGSSAKPAATCYAATKALTVFMLRFLIEIGELDRERVLGRVGLERFPRSQRPCSLSTHKL